MPRIIFVRPAETDLQQLDCLLGRFDADLNDSGRMTAEKLGQTLTAYRPTYLVASPLKRAVTTALAVEDANMGLSARPVAAFHGMDLGDWEKKSRALLLASDAVRYKSWLGDPDFRAPGGECIREVYARAFPELVNMVHYAEVYETLVFVLEDLVLKALSCGVLDLPLEHAHRFGMDPGAFSCFERLYEGGPYQLTAWNRQTHFAQTVAPQAFLEEETVPL